MTRLWISYGVMLLGVLEEAEMWLSKVSRRAFKSNAISNIFIRFCIRCNYLCGVWIYGIF